MKKYLTFLAIVALAAFVNVSSAFASGSVSTLSSTEKRVVTTLLQKEINRDLILELELNEMQYIKLKELNRKFKRDTQSSQLLLASAELDAKAQELVNTYAQAVTDILTEKQLNAFITNQTVQLTQVTK
ncbi:hypothetical protein [Pontibacter sp. SGAir0037]|uniref:hypothetical protein n=1 Tax=Pontibacter sp. SGAir0037 TaxID=2571030 RepID=UPI0010CCDAF3|nr:hypothetical protein [Pontibacter sp. SGAir0037]QCR24121.1 hypothetical protein C1N53_18330 [Pontibacter sp. SGAir0037]